MCDLKLKTVIWVGDSKKNILGFPLEVRREIGHALYFAQSGDTHPSVKMMKGLGKGVYEVVEDYRTDTYRAVYTVCYKTKLYIVHAFQKKSKSGIKTPQEDIKIIEQRLKRIKEIEKDEH
jgi:phage-related protein